MFKAVSLTVIERTNCFGLPPLFYKDSCKIARDLGGDISWKYISYIFDYVPSFITRSPKVTYGYKETTF